MSPEIIDHDQIIVVGVRSVFDVDVTNTGNLWAKEFLPRRGELKAADNCLYAVFNYLPGSDKKRFETVAGVVTNSLEDIPTGMVSWSISSGKYARFTAKGLSGVKQGCIKDLEEWLPTSGYQRLPNPVIAYTSGSAPDDENTEWVVNVPIITPEALAELNSWLDI